MATEFLDMFQSFTKNYQKKTTSFRTPDEVMALLEAHAKDGIKLDLVPFEFQCAVAQLLIVKLDRDISTRPEKLLIALKEALNI